MIKQLSTFLLASLLFSATAVYGADPKSQNPFTDRKNVGETFDAFNPRVDLWPKFIQDPAVSSTATCNGSCSYSAVAVSGPSLVTIDTDASFGLGNGWWHPEDADGLSPYSTAGTQVFNVFATRTSDSVVSDALTVTMIINGSPSISSSAAVSVFENQSSAIDVNATDPNLPADDTLTFSISGGADSGLFSIVAGTGVLTFNTVPDYENPADANTDNDYVVEVTVSDVGNGTTQLTDTQTITVTVKDVDEAPTEVLLSNTVTSVPENTATPLFVADFVIDDTLGTNVFAVAGADAASFQIVAQKLQFKASVVLDFETKTSYSVAVTVDDTGFGGNPDATSVPLVINVTDVDEALTSVSFANTVLAVDENTATPLAVADVVVDDALGNAYTTTGADAASFEVVAGKLQFKSSVNLDFETKASYKVGLNVDDLGFPGGPEASASAITVTINNINEIPIVSSAISAQSHADTNVISLDVSGNFDDEDTADVLQYTSVTLPTGLSIGLTTGIITGTLDVAASAGSIYAVIINASDGALSVNAPFNWTVTNPAPVATPSCPGNQTDNDGDAVSADVSGCFSDDDTMNFSGVGFPAGLSISGAGTISGNIDSGASQVSGGIYNITITATDAQGAQVDADVFSLTVSNVAPILTAPTPLVDQADFDGEGVSYSTAFAFDDGGSDNDTLNYGAVGLPPGLSIDNLNGDITGTIDGSASQGGLLGAYSVTVTAIDGQGGTVNDTLVWQTNNTSPVSVDDSGSTDEDTVVNVAASGVLANDTDADGDSLVVDEVEGATINVGVPVILASGARVVVNANGSFVYSPNGQFENLANGDTDTDTFTYQNADGEGGAGGTATATVTINGVNDLPSFGGINAGAISEDAAANVSNALTISDVDDGEGAFTTGSLPGTYGALVINNGAGSWTYNINNTVGGNTDVLDIGDIVQDVFNVTTDDNAGTTTTVTITIAGANDSPVVSSPVTVTATEDAALFSVDMLEFASDVDADDAISTSGVTLSSGDASGVTINGDNLDVDPNAYNALAVGESEVIVYNYTIKDTHGGSVAQSATITINGVNDAPSALADANITDEDSVLNANAVVDRLTTNDSDPDTSDLLTVGSVEGNPGDVGSQITLASGALLTVNTDGSYSYDPNGKFESLAIGESTTDSFQYTATDGNGGDSASTAVTITINGVNDAPVGAADTGTADEDNILSVAAAGVLGNDTDADTSDTLVVKSVNGNMASVGTQITLGSGALLTLNANGSYSYDPNGVYEALAQGESTTENFQYVATDNNGGDTGTTTVVITINGVNDTPSSLVDTGVIDEDNVLTVAATGVLNNDSDPDGSDVLSVKSVNGVPGDVGSQITLGSGALLTMNANGGYSYNPNGQFEYLAVTESTTDSFQYVATDSNGGDTPGTTVTITINGVNDTPLGVSDPGSTDEDNDVTVNAAGVLVNDTDADTSDNLTIKSVNGNPADVGNQIALGSGALLRLNGDGSYNYDPNGKYESLAAGESATETFQYVASDGNGGDTASTTVTMTINGVNDNPTVSGAELTTVTEDNSGFNFNLLTNASDVDTTDVLSVNNLLNTGGNNVGITDNGDTLGVDPNAYNFLAVSESEIITYSYTVEDDNAPAGSVGQTASITITGVNDSPTGTDDADATGEDSVLNVGAGAGVLANDTDPDNSDVLAVKSVNGNAGDVGNQIALGSGALLKVNADGSFDYDPNGKFETLAVGESTTESFQYVGTDGNGGDTNTQTVTITINGVNDNPVVTGAESATTTEDNGAFSLNMLANASDVDASDVISVANLNKVSGDDVGITVSVNSLNIDPNAYNALAVGESEVIVYNYDVVDDNAPAGSVAQVATITITGVNDDPTSVADTGSANEDSVLTVNGASGVLVNDTDPDTSDSLSVKSVNGSAINVGNTITLVSGSKITLNFDGGYTYDPNGQYESLAPGESTTDSFQYVSTDSNGGNTASTTVTITINGDNDNPAVSGAESTTITEDDAGFNFDLLTNASDIDTTDVLNVANLLNTGGDDSGITDNGNNLGVDPNAYNALAVGESEVITWSYLVEDDNAPAGNVGQNATITVTGLNDTPSSVADTGTTDEDNVLLVGAAGVLGNDVDPDASDTLTVSSVNGNAGDVGAQVTLGSGALLTLNANGSYNYDPNGQYETLAVGESTTDSFQYVATDNHGADTGSATVTITINGVNDAPSSVIDTGITDEDNVLTVAATGVVANDTDPDTSDVLTVKSVNGSTGDVGSQITLASGALLTLNADGGYSYDPNGAFESLAVTESTTDTFQYVATDSNGGDTSSATVTITINGVNDTPVGVADSGATSEDAPVTVPAAGVLANDTDVDASDGISVKSVNGSTGDVGNLITLGSGAQLTLNTNGSYTYDPNGQFEALAVTETTTDSFQYVGTDGNGGDTASTTVTITISGVNDSPTSVNDTGTIDEDNSLSVGASGVLTNDTDPDVSDTLAVKSVNGNTGDVGAQVTLGSGALLTLNSDGSYNYDPNSQFEYLAVTESASDSFQYVATDNNGGDTGTATVNLTVTGVNDAPTVSAAVTSTSTEDDAAYVINLLDNASDVDVTDTINISGISLSSGDDSGTSSSGNTLNVNPSAYNYLAVGESAVIDYAYSVIDGNGGTVAQTVTVTITGVNDTPTALADTGSTDEDNLVTVAASGVLANDTDPDTTDTLTVKSVNGSTLDVGNQVTLLSGALVTLSSNGGYNYDPNDQFESLAVGENTTDVFSYVSTDSNGGDTSSVTVTVTVNGVNDNPVVSGPETSSATEDDAPYIFNLLTNASDVDTTDVISVSNLTLGGGDDSGVTTGGNTLSINPGAYNYLAQGESAVISYNYDVVDDNLPAGSVSQTATITIIGVNDAPTVSGPESASATEDDASFVIDLLLNASDVDLTDILSATGLALASGDGSGVTDGGNTVTVDPNAYNYLAVGESAVIIYNYTVRDDNVFPGTVAQTLTITITGVNDTPTGNNDTDSTDEDSPLVVAAPGVLANDTDPDTSDSLLVNQVEGSVANTGTQITLASGARVTLNADGSFTYDPNGQFENLATGDTDSDDFGYDISDSNGGFDTNIRVNLTINGVNDAPTSADETVTVNEDGTYTFQVSDFAFVDVDDGDSMAQITIVSLPSLGDIKFLGIPITAGTDIAVGQISSLTYEPVGDDDGSGYTDFDFLVNDGEADSAASYTMTVDVVAVADIPNVAANATVTTNEDTAVNLGISASLNDATNETLSVSISGLPGGASITDGTNSSSTGTTDITSWTLTSINVLPGLHDSVDFTLTVTATATEAANSDTASASADTLVTVTPIADAPTLTVVDGAGSEDLAIDISSTITGTLVDPSEVLRYELAGVSGILNKGTNNGGGSWTLTAAEVSGLTLTPPLHDSDNFNITVDAITDDSGVDQATTSGNFDLVVTGVADAPLLAVANANGDEDVPIVLDITGTLVDPSETLSYQISGVSGTLSAGTDQGGGVWTLAAGDVAGLTITPPINDYSSFTLTVTAISTDEQGNAAENTATTVKTISTSVNRINDFPTLGDYTFTVAENTANGTIVGTVTGTDVETDQTLTYTTTDTDFAVNPATGAITVAQSSSLDYESIQVITFTVTATDNGSIFGNPDLSDDGTITINLTPVNDNAPVGVTDAVSVDEGAILNFDVLANDTDADVPADSLTVTEVFGDPGQVGMPIDLSLIGGPSGTLTVYSNGSATFATTADNTVEIYAESFDYTVSDGVFSGTGFGAITINPRNDNQPTLSPEGDDLVADGIEYDEDDQIISPLVVQLNNMFLDLDIDEDAKQDYTGLEEDSLVFTVTNDNSTVLTATLNGGDLELTSPADEHGVANVTVTATDQAAPLSNQSSVDLTFQVTVNSVNDAPLYGNGLPTGVIAVDEDAAPYNIDFTVHFSDADLNDSDGSDELLTYTLTIVDTPNEFVESFVLDESSLNVISDTADVPVAGARTVVVETTAGSISLPYVADAHGTLDISIVAADLGRPPLAPAAALPLSASASIDIEVQAIGDDTPEAFDDHYSTNPDLIMDEDGDSIVFDVTVNDYKGDVPLTVISVGETIVDDFGIFHRWRTTSRQADPDGLGSNQTTINGEVSCSYADCQTSETGNTVVDGSALTQFQIVYAPLNNFNGEDSFTYCIQDDAPAGEPAFTPPNDDRCATVTLMVNPVNDPPVPIEDPIVFTMVQADDLATDFFTGLRSKFNDVDNTHFDGFGCDPLDPGCTSTGDALFFRFASATTLNGQLLPPFAEDGSFNYRPSPTFSGSDEFVFDVCDRPFADAAPENCLLGMVATIEIEPLEGAPEGSTDDAVEFDYQLAQKPLELPVGPEPNVLIVNDDSGSMAWDILTDQNSGLYYFSTGNYIYYVTKASAGSSSYVAPGETDAPNQGLWRLRYSGYNSTYYNPDVMYEPWPGLDLQDNEFPDSPPTAARHNPLSSSQTTNLTQTQTYTGRAVLTTPRVFVCTRYRRGRCRRGYYTGGSGFQSVTVNNYYIPRYYVWTDRDGDGNVDSTPSPAQDPANSEGTLIEIKSANGPFPKGDDRSDCIALPNNCSYDEELQNFANWFSYARDRELSAKYALSRVVAESENIRLGYAKINSTSGRKQIASMNQSARTGAKAELLDSIYTTGASGGTPLRRALRNSGRYYECVDSNIMGVAASNPGSSNCPVQAAPEGNCQQNFTLLMTDGTWNGSSPYLGDPDDDNNTNFDGGVYAGSPNDTLADVAMHYYERDIHPDLSNEVPTTSRDQAGADDDAFENSNNLVMHQHMSTYTIGFGVIGVADPEDVPNYNTGFDWGNPFSSSARKIDDLLHAAVNGRGDYLNASNVSGLADALVAAFQEFAQGSGAASAVSFNSQEVQQDTTVFRAFYNTKNNTGDLVSQVIDDNGVVLSTRWSAAEKLDQMVNIANDRVILTYNDFTGEGVPFRPNSLSVEAFDYFVDDPGATAIQKNIEVTQRVNYLRGDNSNERPIGNFRERPTVKGRLGDIVHSAPVFVGVPDRLGRDTLPYPQEQYLYSAFKNKPAMVNRAATVYVAANDGMLHGFDAVSGMESMAYMPNYLMLGTFSRKIGELLSFEYEHKYFLDLTPAINDVFINADGLPSLDPGATTDKEWETIAVGGSGAGAKGYYALRLTDPADYSESLGDPEKVVMWEFTDDDDTYPTTGATYEGMAGTALLNSDGNQRLDVQSVPKPVKDLGYSFSVPSLQMSNVVHSDGEQEWVGIFGNGFNSTSGIAKLFVLFLDRGVDGVWCHPDRKYDNGLPGSMPSCSGQDFVKVDTGFGVATSGPLSGFPNGLGQPRAIDVDSNGTVDYVYAGDIQGNFYRFDLTSDDPDDWESVKIFEAKYISPIDGSETPQSITTQPIVLPHPTEADGFIVIFATGSFVTIPDGSNTDIQSVYGLWDRLTPKLIDKDELQLQHYTNLYDADVGFVRTLSSNAVDYKPPASKQGWYIDLDSPSVGGTYKVDSPEFPGERAIRSIQLRGGLAFTNSIIPRSDTSCEEIAGGFALAFCPGTGGLGCVGTREVFDINNDGSFSADDKIQGQTIGGMRFEDAVPTDSTFIDNKRITQLSDQTLDLTITNTGRGDYTGRLSWKELESIE